MYFCNRQHFALCTGCTGVACPLPAFGGSIRPWLYTLTTHLTVFPELKLAIDRLLGLGLDKNNVRLHKYRIHTEGEVCNILVL